MSEANEPTTTVADQAEPSTGSAVPTLGRDQRLMLGVLADTFAPPATPPAVAKDDPSGFWARRGTDLGIGELVADRLEVLLPPEELGALVGLLTALRTLGFHRLPQGGREAVLRTLGVAPTARAGLDGLRALSLQLYYGAVGPDGSNPNWTQLGYPGPPAVDAPTDRLATWTPDDASAAPIDLDAEVVVIGSGSGGGVIAGELAAAGVDVVVLEAGRHLEADGFPADELSAMQAMYWRGGLTPTVDGNVAIVAGATLGGGSTINWQNCVRPPDAVRARWADDHGLTGLDDAAFDGHLDAVLERISATADCTDLNGVNRRLAEAADTLGWAWTRAVRNTDPGSYDPVNAGHVGFGDRSGSKQGTLVTYLRDAAAAGARIICGARVDQVLTEAGRAAGVEAVLTAGDGSTRRLTVRAGTVVVAAGALETPAVLLRSGLGGPAVGQHLRLHPVPMLAGLYDEDLRAWWGPPQATVITEHRAAVEGHGYLVETAHNHPSVTAAALPWTSGRDHKLLMGRYANLGTFIAVTRDHGGGTVTIDDRGEAVISYPLTDPIDAEVQRHAVKALIDLHVAAGARAILDTGRRLLLWRQGEDVDAYTARVQKARTGAGGRVLFSAHQMGSARMGADPASSVADPVGQLHDTAGVWVGDTSAFPTAVGSNPMLTCMALARRTAHAILAAR